jgi:hypothetical protein
MSEPTAERGPGHAPFPWVQLGALVLGTLLLLYGMIGFWPSFSPPGADGRQPTLLGIEVNALRSALQLLLGVIGMVSATRLSSARLYGWVLAAVSAVFVVFGIIGITNPDADWLGMNVPAVVVAGVFAVLGLGLALGPVHEPFPGGEREEHAVHGEPGRREER